MLASVDSAFRLHRFRFGEAPADAGRAEPRVARRPGHGRFTVERAGGAW